ncbi:glycoside hydrolase family 1 protein [Mycoplasma todarodis]|uniref:Glycoside hydrolase family 1 protein n=1 Tax=Mycoplasma todarodis TaxID=1937191 RepID=A0A4R0XSB0_9MOLU|nr:glycoside hydrolase family 1 protein [Mycoplasma todarodis]TCG11310.1 glycoside hydrolase family 1 protein [Mycoplasma todarodis]
MKKFNEDFIFSASTCAFQIEGGRNEGGREHSIWDKFTIENFYIPKEGEAAREINSIEVAADFYNRYKEDVKIMKHMGMNGFTYNMDWARIMPNSSGKPNEEGLKFYEDMFKELVENGIKPIPILYHWDTPLWLEEMGGASDRVFIEHFRQFVAIVFERLGKYTNIWYVNDENSTFTTSSYLQEYSPPLKNNKREFWSALHNLNLTGAICKKEFLKAKEAGFVNDDAILGIDHDWSPAVPYDANDKDDLEACKIFDQYHMNMFLDPNMLGEYPECFWKELKKDGVEDIVQDGDMELLKKYTLDLVGWNYYRPTIIAAPKRMKEDIDWFNEPGFFISDEAWIVYPKSERYTDWKWLIKPEYLVPGSKKLYERYKKPLMIIENGMGYFDKREDNVVKDSYRIDFLNEHILQVQKAIDEGVPFIGYSLWTYCDIFSPSGGYRKKYGLVGVDFEGETLDRYPKSSFYWYKDVITNKRSIEGEINYNKYFEEAKEDFKNNKEIWNK